MESSLSESVQQLVRPGKCVDLYYPDPETAEKCCFRTSVNTRYSQDFTNTGAGTSVFTIPANNGVQDIIVQMSLPATAQFPTGSSANLGVCRGWGYGMIKQVSYRVGGSSQFFLTGQQVLQAVLSTATDSGSRDALLSLGGNATTNDGTTDGFAVSQSAYCVLPLPWTIPSSEGKLPPLPSDLLTQQIVITCELYAPSKVFSISTGGSLSRVPTQLKSAKFQLQQVLLENQGDALARRVDMTSHALSFPINFRQQEVQIQLAGGSSISAGSSQQVSLTGFRSGEVAEVHAWLTADSDSPTPAVPSMQNPFAWYPLTDAKMTYAGEVYADFSANSGQLWNLLNGRIPAQVNDIKVKDSGSYVTITTASADKWTILPFAQCYDAPTAHSMYVAGKNITNGIINLSFTIPPDAITSAYTLHVSYVYRAVLTFSQGSADYVF